MKKALFLDRDGVINHEYNYVHKIESFDFIPGIFEFCKFFLNQGYLIVIITNQAGIARGYYTEKEFWKLTKWMLAEFEIKGIEITKAYCCPHHPEFTGACNCRKPNPGMLLKASKDFGIDLESSMLVGDKESDLNAGINAGLLKEKCYLFNGSYKDIITKCKLTN
ncbi:D-glycero-beta-D-manno-heptose 1,7-bisphosphate 7-phosphatase [Labilibaculum sp. A4]|uniref:D-glycero-alpha-D-manno-heptose-1,7-bisphosphate 7-phosphatase n=1 Tax=Labilibaculum euxinus TaxID=2686357 RepID=UPI000F6183CE|nr:HAD family hydrolase [Labilibaculum euxinus]MDQ1772726.1 HAD family hydrolase [Labilibaculum euxinus]MWN78316.1 D-glycero-beta-D-manno-heptose 1,7-bisphosphate 7-phosphatase [Labilibaculum euxinus]